VWSQSIANARERAQLELERAFTIIYPCAIMTSNMKLKNTVLIFDFDGTIADTHHYLIKISNQLSSEFHYKTIPPGEIPLLKNKTSQEVIQHLKVPMLKIPAIIAKAKKLFYENMDSLDPFAGLTEVLDQLKSKNITMGILSSNTAANIHRFLQTHQLDIFDFIHTTSNVWSKNIVLAKLLRDKKLAVKDTIYIGDEIRDIVAAQRLNLRVAAVTWGYNSSDSLRRHHPTFLIDKPAELLNLVDE
jgi:phosphoglycolate phosphatase